MNHFQRLARTLYLPSIFIGLVITLIGAFPAYEPNFMTDLGQVFMSVGWIILYLTPSRIFNIPEPRWIFHQPVWAKERVYTKLGLLLDLATVSILAFFTILMYHMGERLLWSTYTISGCIAFLTLRSMWMVGKSIYKSIKWYRDWNRGNM